MKQIRTVSTGVNDRQAPRRDSCDQVRRLMMHRSATANGVCALTTIPQSAWDDQHRDADRWRTVLRPQALRLIARGTRTLIWNERLLKLLLEELHVDDVFFDLFGSPSALPRTRYAQAVAVTIALRHSWRRDDLFNVARRLGIRLRERDLRRLAKQLPLTTHGPAEPAPSNKGDQRRSSPVGVRRHP